MKAYTKAEHAKFSKTHKLISVRRIPEIISHKGQLLTPARHIPKEVYRDELMDDPPNFNPGDEARDVSLLLPGGKKIFAKEKAVRRELWFKKVAEVSSNKKEAVLNRFLYYTMKEHGIKTSRPLYIRKQGVHPILCTEKLPGVLYRTILDKKENFKDTFSETDHESVFKKIGDFLAVAYFKGISPLDLSPHSLMIDKGKEGEVKVGFFDFGEYNELVSSPAPNFFDSKGFDHETFFDNSLEYFMSYQTNWNGRSRTYNKLVNAAKSSFRKKLAELSGIPKKDLESEDVKVSK